jgi:hypothetical protein
VTKLEPAMRQYALDTLYNWYNETDNPLYVWEALSVCLSDDERLDLPDWCLHYLRSAAGNLYKLSRGFDFRSPAGTPEKISSDKAHKLVSNALSLSKQGKRNAFASLWLDRDDVRSAITETKYGHDGVPGITKRRSIEPESARRRIARGKRLLRVKSKTSA